MTARAKINLTLEVLGRRGDGYHEVKTILQTVDLSDRLAIEPSSDLKVECDQAEINGEDNLVWSAAIALAHRCGIAPRARIVIHKGIPVSMGLGGGSSDAAAALVALNQLWQLGLSGGQLAETAAEIGSDASFFLTGGTALGEGRGELITQLPGLPSIPVTLICPNVALPRKTAAMYSLLNSAQFSDGGSTDNFARILLEGRFVLKSIGELTFNVFEQVADQALPELAGRHLSKPVAVGRFGSGHVQSSFQRRRVPTGRESLATRWNRGIPCTHHGCSINRLTSLVESDGGVV